MNTTPIPAVRPLPRAAGPRAATSGVSLSLPFANDPRCLGGLRAAAAAFLRDTRPARAAHLADVLLVVTELAANVVRHTDGPGQLTLVAHPDGTRIEASDTSRALPVVLPFAPGLGHGRGLLLVRALAENLSLTLDPGSGKTIRATLRDRSA
ncbi:ATP-binding protein [Kitasatospora sp. NPDC001603]|uniref:ATP-binding protein n=1 Tax=Kitasatospora sp. NPDC001603 TaxID=3154388 RepID=UPI003317BA45